MRWSHLPLDRLSDVFDRLTDLPAAMADGVLRPAGGFVCHAFVLERRIVGQPSDSLFQLALCRLGFAFHLIAVHVRLPPQVVVRYTTVLLPLNMPTMNSTIAMTRSTCTNAPIV